MLSMYVYVGGPETLPDFKIVDSTDQHSAVLITILSCTVTVYAGIPLEQLK